MNDDQRRHLEFLQAAISRMAQNSFTIKGWAITLASGLLGFAAKESNRSVALIVILPAILFAILDGYYLALEKALRSQYELAVRDFGLPSDELVARIPLYAIRPQLTLAHLADGLFSKITLVLYATLTLSAVLISQSWI